MEVWKRIMDLKAEKLSSFALIFALYLVINNFSFVSFESSLAKHICGRIDTFTERREV